MEIMGVNITGHILYIWIKNHAFIKKNEKRYVSDVQLNFPSPTSLRIWVNSAIYHGLRAGGSGRYCV